MGVHHFNLELVPPGVVPTREEDGRYAGGFLKTFPIPDPIAQRLRQIFTRPNHWGMVDEYCSETQWGGDLRICRSDLGQIEEVGFRFAPVADSLEKLREFVAITKDAGCFLLVCSSGEVIAPDFGEVMRALREHHSFKFLSDPKGTIVEAAQKIEEHSDVKRRNKILKDLDDSGDW